MKLSISAFLNDKTLLQKSRDHPSVVSPEARKSSCPLRRQHHTSSGGEAKIVEKFHSICFILIALDAECLTRVLRLYSPLLCLRSTTATERLVECGMQ